MTDIITIPLSKLIAWEGNARRTMSEDGLIELASSIEAHGLLQSLVVKKHGKKYAVVAGNRRLMAMQRLAGAASIAKDYPVPCQLIADEQAGEVNLAENVIRESMHPADEFEAFQRLAAQGKSTEDVAAAFGVTPHVVKRRLKLANVSPKVLQAYRAEDLGLEQVMAFAITDDHDAQDALLHDLKPSQSASDIRDHLTEGEVHTKDRRVTYIGLKAYEKAGGTLKPDLFSEHDDAYLEDPALLNKLVLAKLEKHTAKIRKEEDWSWIEARAAFSYSDRSAFKQVYAEPAPLSPEQQAEVDRLEAECRQLETAWENDPDEEAPYPARCDEIKARLDEIEDREAHYTPEQLAYAGAVVSIDHKGKAEVTRGLVRPEDMPKAKAKAAKPTSAPEGTPALSATLIESLTEQKSAAIAARVLDMPTTALAAVVHAMVGDIFGNGDDSAMQITCKDKDLSAVEGSKAFDKLKAARDIWGSKIPADGDARWAWCLMQDQDSLLDLLAFCAASTLDGVKKKGSYNGRFDNAGKLASEVELDMAEWFTPTAENYFSKIGKPQIIEALQEADASLPAATMKKGDMAKFAEEQLAGKGWLPEILRIAG